MEPYIFSFTVIFLCIAITVLFRLFGRSQLPFSASDIATLPYSFGVAGITANVIFLTTMPANPIMNYKIVIIALLTSIVVMGFIALYQRTQVLSEWRTQIYSSVIGFAILIITYALWISGSLIGASQ
jgi:hypothetical protein